ncbi:MAG: ribonuclease P protein component [Pseudomonadota bacterium]
MNTLKDRQDFITMNKKAARWTSHGLVLQALPNDLDKQRVGFTVTKKTEKSAVKRNRMKRRLREIAREILPEHAPNGYDFVLIGRRLSATRPFDTLKNDLIWCLEKLELKKK